MIVVIQEISGEILLDVLGVQEDAGVHLRALEFERLVRRRTPLGVPSQDFSSFMNKRALLCEGHA